MSKKILIFCALQLLFVFSFPAQAMKKNKTPTKTKCPKLEKHLKKIADTLQVMLNSFNYRDPYTHPMVIKNGQKK